MPITWLTGAPGGVDEPWETPHSAHETWANDKLTASVQLRVAWAQRYAVMENILVNALRWPYHAATTPLRATHGQINTMDGVSITGDEPGGNAFEHAILTVDFESAEATEDEVVYSESIEPTAEFLTLPHDGLFWDAGATEPIKVAEAPGVLLPGFDYKLTYYNLASIPSAFITLIGKCNDPAVSTSMFGSLAAETLLYNPPTMSRSLSFGGDNRWTLSTRLTYRYGGWNKHWRVETGAWSYQYRESGAAHKPIIPASFAGILPDGI
jgi:hypothetical protein